MGEIHILVVPEHEHSRKPYGERWCFACRKRMMHDFVVMAPDDIYSYYGPRPKLECAGCGKDRSAFPGVPVDWEEP